MDDYTLIMLAEAIAEAFFKILWFSCGWFLIYVTLGTWLKVYLVHLKAPQASISEKRFGPILVCHLLFSVLLVNPFVLLWLAFYLDNIDFSIAGFVFLAIFYFLFLPVAFDSLLLRIIPRWKRLKWFRYQFPLKRAIPVSLLVGLVAFGAGFCSIQLRDFMPTLARAFPIRPKAFDWKVDTTVRLTAGRFITSGTDQTANCSQKSGCKLRVNIPDKPLVDASVPAESDRMIIDDKYIYVKIYNKYPTWKVVDRMKHKVLGDESEALAYVLANDSGGTWQIRRKEGKILYGRVFGRNLKTVPIGISSQAVFLEHQIGGIIVGANPAEGHLFAFDPKRAEVLWEVRAPAVKDNRDRRIGSIAGMNDVVIVGLWTSRVWAVDAKTGQHLWLFEEEGMGNSMYVEVSKAGILGFSRSKKVYLFSSRTGELKWSKLIGDLAGGIGEGNACLFDNKLIFRSKTTVTCMDVDSGEIIWQSTFGNHYAGGVSCSNNGIVACASDRSLGLLNADSGQKIFHTKFPARSGIEYGFYDIKKAPGHIYTHPVVTDQGEVYVFTTDGVLWALKPEL